MRVLIVDDSETTGRLLRAIVRSRGWMICGEADSGHAGVEQYQKLKPDLVLIDLALPDMNGIEAGRHMSALNRNVPLILFTILDAEELQTAARQAGIRQVVSKANAWALMQGFETAAIQPIEQRE